MKLSDTEPRAYSEVVEFFASGPRPVEIIKFRPSAETQEHVRELLAKNASDSLTVEEQAELNVYSNLEHIMRLVKARARMHIKA